MKARYDAEDERKRLLDWLEYISWKYKLDCIYDDEVFRIRFPKINDCFYKIKIDFYSDSFNTWIYRAESEYLIGRTLSSKHWKFVEHQARYVPSKNSNVLFEDYIESVIKDLLKENRIMDNVEKHFDGIKKEIDKQLIEENKKLRFRHNFNILPKIKKVIFNNPATIVLWNDGTKTVVKCRKGDSYDQEKGLAMAISKKVLGNKYNYYDIFKRLCKETVKEDATYYADNIVEVHIKMEE